MAGAESLERSRRIHQACESFEIGWRADRRSRIEELLDRGHDDDRAELLVELLALEVELRRERGEQPVTREYLARFPEHEPEVNRAFADAGPPDESFSIGFTRSYPPCLADAGTRPTDPPETAPEGRPPHGPIELGLDFGDFELLAEVGRGGMGVVFKARKRSLNCLVALKVLSTGSLASEAERRRFLLEAEAAANLDHPHIVPVYEIDPRSGLYFSMKWVEGGHLGRQVERLKTDPRAAARLVATIALAVHAAHRQGYLHRDLKPSNVLMDDRGRPYVTDFGLVRKLGYDSSLTQSGAVLGTPAYMAPEQASGHGKEVGPEADIYSLGAILYELLTGRPPFRAATVMETLIQVLERDPVRPGRLRRGVPPDLEAICLKCLEKDPDARYPSAEALAEDLERALRGEEVQAMRGGLRLRLRRWIRRETPLVSRLIGLGVVLALTQYNFLLNPDRDLRLHVLVSLALVAWAVASAILQSIARKSRRRDAVRPAWAVADAVFLTMILRLLDAESSSMVVGYPLVVAASGLWFRVGTVWLATALAEAGYTLLVLDAWLRGTLWRQDHHPNIVMAAIAVTGFVVARQVKRLLVLSSYYEQRMPS